MGTIIVVRYLLFRGNPTYHLNKIFKNQIYGDNSYFTGKIMLKNYMGISFYF